MKKRQEIGRGLRLAVKRCEGKRIRDKNINKLTVISNEAYGDFVKSLQKN
jgi:type III restriction enzyme